MDLKNFISDFRLSQKELSEVFGCSPTNVSNIVSGKRNLTGLQIRLLIDKYGYEAISKYADATELPPVSGGSGSVEAVNSNVQNGDGNSITADAALIQVMKQQSDQNSALIAELAKRSEQMDRLISLLEQEQDR